jgi:hypothetical protein
VPTAPTTIIAMLVPSAPLAAANSPSPAATPRYATAGIIVTEMATPTDALARGL